jgi:shikimate dehydrogenase
VKIYGLIGKPLDHSWSQSYFEEKFRKENIKASGYSLFELEDIADLRKLVLADPRIAGLNVTIPYKISVIDHLDRLHPEAQAIGAVNCITVSRNGNHAVLEGHNTDYLAFFQTLLPFLPRGINKALVLGTGGASRAVCHALRIAGIEPVVVSRNRQEGMMNYEDVDGAVIRGHLLIVNTTPLGTAGFSDIAPPLPYKTLSEEHILYDLTYNPLQTRFLKNAVSAGAEAVNGLEMLQIQAELSWKVWNS